MLGVVTGIVLQFSLDGNCLRVRLLELSYYGVGDYSGNGARGLFGESFWELGRKCQIWAQLVNLLKWVLFGGDGEGRGEGASFTYFTFSSDLDTGFYFLPQ